MSKITKFWVVTKPSRVSGIRDILFLSNIKKMANQYLGGLDKEDIIGIYSNKKEAEVVAKKLLEKVRNA